MARKKQYNEQEVLQKAMMLFWKNGYETTSVRMLEKEMGINQFSIYASFKSKELLFAQCLKLYHDTVGLEPMEILKTSKPGIAGIREYFNIFLTKTYIENKQMGCFMVNAMQDAVLQIQEVVDEIERFKKNIEQHFFKKLNEEVTLDDAKKEILLRGTIVGLYGFASASRVFPKDEMMAFVDRILML